MKLKNNNKFIYLLSFGITFILYLLLGVLLKLYPLSDSTVLFSDMNEQFVSFYNGFKHLLSSNNNLFYTFSKNLGGDMIGFSAYYLQNPFQFILLLFPYKMMPLGIFLMQVIMMSTASLTFQIFLTKTFGKSNLIISTAYAFMGEVLAYFSLSIYFCNYILLPVEIMGLYRMYRSVEDDGRFSVKDNLLYIVTLAASIICNYYLGYMLCIFLVLYFAYICICEADNNRIFARFKAFVISSILGVALSCFDLVPVALSLRNQKEAPSSSIFSFDFLFNLKALYKTFLPGRFNSLYSSQILPYAYMGAIILFFSVFLFISKRVKKQEKLATLSLIAVLIFCLWFKPLNTVWHAFNEPVGFPYRFAFYLSFLLLIIAYKGMIEVEFIYDNRITELNHAKAKELLSNKGKIVIRALLCSVMLLEIFYNAYFIMRINVSESKSQSHYTEFYDRFNPVITKIKEEEANTTGTNDSLYRVEKDYQYTQEDSIAFDYAGLTHNSSCEKDYVKAFVGKMGLRNQGIWAFYYQGGTTFTDCFLGVKYFVSRFDETEKPYDSIFNTEDSFVFENPYALPFAFVMDEEKTNMIKDGEKPFNTFEFQNEIASAFDFDSDIYTEARVSEIRVYGDNVILSDELKKHASLNESEIVKVKEMDAKPANEEKTEIPSYIEFDVSADKAEQILYMYFSAPKMQGARIYVNGMDWDDYFSDWRWAVEKCGRFNEGDIATVRIECTGEELIIDDYQLYFEDPEMIKEWYESADELGASSVDLTKVSSSHIKGSFNASKDGLLVFSIPYEDGWTVKIDGNTVTKKEVLSALMAVNVSEGEHTIELNYLPSGLTFGCFISLIALFIINMMLRKQNKEKNKGQ